MKEFIIRKFFPIFKRIEKLEKEIEKLRIENDGEVRLKMQGGYFRNEIAVLHNRFDGNKLVYNALLSDKSLMISRHGAVEVNVVFDHLMYNKIKEEKLNKLCYNAGFFPRDQELAKKWVRLYLESCNNIDYLCAMIFRRNFDKEQNIFNRYSPRAKILDTSVLCSAHKPFSWTEALENKKVLVVHPFKKSIESQYERREFLFTSSKVLPKFKKLEVVKAVQSIAGTKTEFDSWFSALDHMKEEIKKRDFDIALIGAGSYGLILSSFVKSLDKKAVHLGGILQLLFGIKGKRWERYPNYNKNIVNKYWVKPLPEETPENASKVEGGCYW